MKIAVIPGDGIGPEVVEQTIVVLNAVGRKFNHRFYFEEVLMGGTAIDAVGVPLPDETLEICRNSDAVLLGAVGGPKWDNMPGDLRPEAGLLGIRKALGLFANIRPAKLFPQLKSASTLKEEVFAEDGLDILVVRELTGDLYFGDKGREELPQGGQRAWDVAVYTTHEVERVARVAFDIARGRRRKVASIDKANVLESSRLWREVVSRVGKDYPDIELSHMYVDNAAMQLVRNPAQFDVILTTNMFGDILSDEAAMLTGSLGMLPSASLGQGRPGLYEPVNGSAPDIAGQDKANPIATIMSAAMMLRYSFGMDDEALAVEESVGRVLQQGYRTPDIAGTGMVVVGTREMGRLIAENI